MKYSIRGNSPVADGSDFVSAINKYSLWRLVTNNGVDRSGNPLFAFESWINALTDKDSLWSDLKLLIDIHTGTIDWHECTHDEVTPQPCSIAETYSK